MKRHGTGLGLSRFSSLTPVRNLRPLLLVEKAHLVKVLAYAHLLRQARAPQAFRDGRQDLPGA
jgi:hypothetical protein